MQSTSNGCLQNGAASTNNGTTENGHGDTNDNVTTTNNTSVNLSQTNQDIVRLIGQYLKSEGLK